MNSYMLMIRGSWGDWNKNSPEEMQAIVQRHCDWAESLKKANRFKGGAGLSERSRLVRSDGSQKLTVIDGPFTETKEALTGYYVIEAKDLDEATRIARECPALQHGEMVEVIEMGH